MARLARRSASRASDPLSSNQPVSAPPQRAATKRTAAKSLRDDVIEAGMEHARLLESAGHPSVYADWLHAGTQSGSMQLRSSIALRNTRWSSAFLRCAH